MIDGIGSEETIETEYVALKLLELARDPETDGTGSVTLKRLELAL